MVHSPAILLAAKGGVAAGAVLRLKSLATTPPATTTPPVTTDPTPTPAAGTHNLLRTTTAQPESFRRLESRVWSTPLHPQAPVASSSARLVTALIGQLKGTPSSSGFKSSTPVPYNTITQGGKDQNPNYSAPTYTVDTSVALQKVYVQDNKTVTDRAGVSRDLRSLFDQGVPVPDPTLMPSGTLAADGTDGHIMIFQKYTATDGVQTARLYEFWQFRPAYSAEVSNGYNWRCVQGGYIDDIRYHPGWWTGSDQDNVGGNWGVSASGASYANATLTGRDWQRYKVGLPLDHPLILQVIFSGGQPEDLSSGSYANGNFYLPACRYDRMDLSGNTNSDSYRIPEGSRFRLDPAVWTDSAIDSYATANAATNGINGADAAQLSWFLRGMRSYGLIAAETAGVMAIVAEHPKTYGTIYNPYTEVPQWGNLLQKYPTTGVVAVKHPGARVDYPTGQTFGVQDEIYDYSLAPLTPGTNLWPSAVMSPTDTSSFGKHGSGSTLSMDSNQILGKPTVLVTYSGASGDSGVTIPSVTGIAPGDRMGFQVYTRRNVGSKRMKVTVKWRKPDGSAGSETLAPYLTRTIGENQLHLFELTAPQSGFTVASFFATIRAVYDTPANGDSFSFAEPQTWKISSAV